MTPSTNRPRAARSLKIAVVGGGIGGLFAANALRRNGLEVDVYEQAPELTEIGAGVAISPNGVRMLEWVGLKAEIWRIGAKLSKRSRTMRHDGTTVAPIPTADSNGWDASMGVHRADLVEILTGALPDELVHTGHRCVGFEQDDESARVHFDNGVTAEADLVIAADGLHSVLAAEVEKPSEPIYSGKVSYRGLVGVDGLDRPHDEMLIWTGAGPHIMTFPVRAGELMCFAAFIPTQDRMPESWSGRAHVSVLEDAFSGHDPWLDQVIGQMDDILALGVFDREPRDRWINGRLALLGDAAHPMQPHQGQGANMSIEDGAALACLLANMDRPHDEVLATYQQLRRLRTAKVQSQSRGVGRSQASQYDDLADRDAAIKAARDFRLWLFDYDAVAEAEAAAATLTA